MPKAVADLPRRRYDTTTIWLHWITVILVATL
jgi:hypothetical protein